MSTSKFSSAFAFVLVFAAGCDDPDKAQDKCESLVTGYCDRVVSCAVRADLLGAAFTANDLRDECEKHMNTDAHCEDAVRVSDSFNACIDDADALSCGTITAALQASKDLGVRYVSPLPETCRGAVLYYE